MTSSEKSFPVPISGNLLTMLLGVILASFGFSFVMKGIWAIVLALAGGIVNSILLRLVRIKMKTTLPGLIIGYLSGIVFLLWITKHWNSSANFWASTVFVFALGLTRVFLSDDLLVNWFHTSLSGPDIQNKS